MRKFFGFVCLILAIIPCALLAETQVKVSGQVRVRDEAKRTYFSEDAETLDLNFLRARVGVSALVDSNAIAFVQFQDSRDFGTDETFGATSGVRTNSKNVDVHQAYLQLGRFFLPGLFLKAGRTELNYGNERIIGADDWNRYGRSFQGVLLGYHNNSAQLEAFGARGPSEVRSDVDAEDNSVLWGGTIGLPAFGIEGLFLYENIDTRASHSGLGTFEGHTDRYTSGLYGKRAFGRFSLEGNAALQTGTYRVHATSPHEPPSRYKDRLDAFLITTEFTFRLGSRPQLWISVGLDMASGDQNSSDDVRGAFVAPFASYHKFRGYMGYFDESDFIGSPGTGIGLIDLFSRIKLSPASVWSLELMAHHFSAHHPRIQNPNPPYTHVRDVGWEADLTSTTTYVKGAEIQTGASIFTPSEAYANQGNPKPGLWIFAMTTVSF